MSVVAPVMAVQLSCTEVPSAQQSPGSAGASATSSSTSGDASGSQGTGAAGASGGGGGSTASSGTGGGGGILVEEPPCPGDHTSKDDDLDGFTGSEGDCNDCTAQMNPGALDHDANQIDEDCNGAPDDTVTICDAALVIDSVDPLDGARAVGLCQQAQFDSWGVVGAAYVKADGDPLPDSLGHGIDSFFGLNVKAQHGSKMLILSSGTARDAAADGYVDPEGYDKGYMSGTPAGYPKEAAACPGEITGQAHDSAALRLQIRTPTNVRSLRFNVDFYTYGFPGFVCSQNSDWFVALMSPSPSGLPDGNISFDGDGNALSNNVGFIDVCHPQTANSKSYACTLGPDQLMGTGFDYATLSAATGWLQTTAPIETPGAQIELLFAIWDSGDGLIDSTVLIDNFGFDVLDAETTTTVVSDPN